MKILSFNDNNKLKSCILSIGNFDGVHLGHKELLDSMNFLSKEKNIPTLLLTFSPHTNEIIFKKDVKILSPEFLKNKLIKKHNIDYLSVIDFNEEFSKMDIDEFMSRIVNKYNPMYFFIGYDNKFGYNRKGSYDYFSKNIIYQKISFKSGTPFLIDDIEVKSSKIKHMLTKGDVLKANRLLGYKYKIYGKVVKGERIGTKIGFPTANIDLKYKKQLIPSNGVYSVNLKLDKKSFSSICNIGYRPTITDETKLSIEVHILDIRNIDLYKKFVEIEFIKKIRDEIRFKSLNDLKIQITKDVNMLKKEKNG